MGVDGKAYCLDTSGLSNPLESMPEDIHAILWSQISTVILAKRIAVNKEIYDELTHLPGAIGECIKSNCGCIQLEVGDNGWDWKSYLSHVERMRIAHKAVISEYNSD